MRRAFSSLEALAVIGIIAVTAGVSSVGLLSRYQESDLESVKRQMLQALETSQLNAQSGLGDWAVFTRTGIACRVDSSNDCITGTDSLMVNIPSTVTISGLSDVKFIKVSGQPDTEGDIFGTSVTGRQWVISIRKRGFMVLDSGQGDASSSSDSWSSDESSEWSESSSSEPASAYDFPCTGDDEFVIRTVSQLDTAFPAQPVSGAQMGQTFDTATKTLTVQPDEQVYLTAYNPQTGTPVQHYTDDELTVFTNIDSTTLSYYSNSSTCAAQRRAVPQDITALYLTGAEVTNTSRTLTAHFKDRCGSFASHTPYYVVFGRCGGYPGSSSSSSTTSSSSSSETSSSSSSSTTSSASSSSMSLPSSSSSSSTTSSSSSSSSTSSSSSSSSTTSSSSSTSSTSGGYGTTCEDRFILNGDGGIRFLARSNVNVTSLGTEKRHGGVNVPSRLEYSTDDGVTWTNVFSGNLRNRRENRNRDENQRSTLTNFPANTILLFRIRGTNDRDYSRTFTTLDTTSHIRLFRNGNTLPNVSSWRGGDSSPEYIRDYIRQANGVAVANVGYYHVLMLTEMDSTNASDTDYLDGTVIIHVDGIDGACPVSSSSSSSSTSSAVRAPRFKVLFERLENQGNGNAAPAVFVGPQSYQKAEGEWITLVDDNGTALNDNGLVTNVPGLAVERQGTTLRVVNYGSHNDGSKEILDVRVVFDGARVNAIRPDTAPNRPENWDDNVITDGAGGDEADLEYSGRIAYLYTRVTSSNDGYLLDWASDVTSSSSASSVSSGGSSVSNSSTTTSSSSSSVASNDPTTTVCRTSLNPAQTLTIRLSERISGDRAGSCTGDEDGDGVTNASDLCQGSSRERPARFYLPDRLARLFSDPTWRGGSSVNLYRISAYTMRDTLGCTCAQLMNVADRSNPYYILESGGNLYSTLTSFPDYYIRAARSFGCAEGFVDRVEQER